MNCLNRIEIQEFIDNEILTSAKEETESHILSCRACNELYHTALSEKEMVRDILGYLDTNMPEGAAKFRNPLKEKTRSRYIFFAEIIAAAIITGFVLFLRPSDRALFPEFYEQEILLHEFYRDKDLNKLWHSEDNLLFVQDEKGRLILTYSIF